MPLTVGTDDSAPAPFQRARLALTSFAKVAPRSRLRRCVFRTGGRGCGCFRVASLSTNVQTQWSIAQCLRTHLTYLDGGWCHWIFQISVRIFTYHSTISTARKTLWETFTVWIVRISLSGPPVSGLRIRSGKGRAVSFLYLYTRLPKSWKIVQSDSFERNNIRWESEPIYHCTSLTKSLS